MKRLLMACRPGDRLQGLWTTRHKVHGTITVMWWVTFRDNDGEYQETNPHSTPEAALAECRRILEQ